jgi:bifunctional non-homologous end joining protein LigD
MMTKAKETKTTTAKAAKATKPTKAATKAGGKDESEVAGIRISHPERVLYPGTSFTKLDLARYYEAIGKWALPHMAGRPLSLVRCPKGLTGDEKQGCFYMKHSDLWAPPALKRVQIREQKKLGQYLVIEDLAGIVSLVQMNVLEIHTWNSPADDVEHPTRVVFDLDPGPEVPWTAVIEAARLVRDVLGSLELESHVKTTGGRGLHVVVPFLPERTWDESLGFSEGLSAAIAARNPDRYTVSIPKAGREKKILIDYLRNARSQTSIAAYSTRARAGATVSVPLAWEELDARLTSGHFTMATVPGRLQKLKKDPWEKYWKSQQRLTPAILEAVAKL